MCWSRIAQGSDEAFITQMQTGQAGLDRCTCKGALKVGLGEPGEGL